MGTFSDMDIQQRNEGLSYEDELKLAEEALRPVIDQFDVLISLLESADYTFHFHHYSPELEGKISNNGPHFMVGSVHTWPAFDYLDFVHEHALTHLCVDVLNEVFGDELRAQQDRAFTRFSYTAEPEELDRLLAELQAWAMEGATAILTRHQGEKTHAVPIRGYTIGAPEYNKFGQECALITWTHARRQSPDRHWVYPNRDTYITIEADGEMIFDSRAYFVPHGEPDATKSEPNVA